MISTCMVNPSSLRETLLDVFDKMVASLIWCVAAMTSSTGDVYMRFHHMFALTTSGVTTINGLINAFVFCGIPLEGPPESSDRTRTVNDWSALPWCITPESFFMFVFCYRTHIIEVSFLCIKTNWLEHTPDRKFNGPPKCHFSTQYVGWMNLSGVDQIWAATFLLSEGYIVQRR